MSTPLRILAAVGPGDVVKAHDDYDAGMRTASETSITFSSQAFSAFEGLGVRYWAISSHPRAATKRDGGDIIENRPRPEASGWRFHLGYLAYALSLARSARAFRATHAIIDSGTTHWFCLWPMRLLGVKVVPNLHNALRPAGVAPDRRPVRRVIDMLDRLFWRGVRSALGCSPTCAWQAVEMSGGRARALQYRAQFVADDFAGVPPPQLEHGEPVVRLLFVGRVEHAKGVFDLLEVAGMLNARGRAFVVEVCGTGSAFDELDAAVRSAGLEHRFLLHGRLARPALVAAYGRAHLVVVPTRSSFCEGLPMVCAEAVLAGRPVVTSRVSNALDPLFGAVVVCETDDPLDYAEQIWRVALDPRRYAALVAGTKSAAAQFLDRSRGLEATTRALLAPDVDAAADTPPSRRRGWLRRARPTTP